MLQTGRHVTDASKACVLVLVWKAEADAEAQ